MPVLGVYGAKPSPFDHRDFKYARVTAPAKRPPSASVRKSGEPIFNQLNEGSCVINAGVAAIEHLVPGFIGSRSYGYYKTRVLQHDVHEDDGCDPRTALKAFQKNGLPPESAWAYDGLAPAESPMFAKPPPHKINLMAKRLVIGSYQALGQTAGMLNDICDCIANAKLPVMIGIAVFESFESATVARNGKVPLPQTNEALLGYHELLAEAYDDDSKLLMIRNSWDSDWGDHGYAYLPYAYASNAKLLTDANVITSAKLAVPG